jgi:hypothetical protein
MPHADAVKVRNIPIVIVVRIAGDGAQRGGNAPLERFGGRDNRSWKHEIENSSDPRDDRSSM